MAVLLALAVDRLWGEPPASWHPVVWMGHYLGAMGRRVAPNFNAPAPRPAAVFVHGALAWLLGAALVVALAGALVALVTPWPWWWQALALG